MRNYINDFIETFNEYYPFERYILKNETSIDNRFDDAILTEIFVPSTERTIEDFDGDEIYVKLKCRGVEVRMALLDFSDDLIENIIGIILDDFGSFEWQSLYIDYEEEEEYTELRDLLKMQKKLITKEYGVCPVKKYFIQEDTLKLIG